jgi:ribosomal protein L29
MRDYTKMMKYYEKRSQIKIKEDLEKEVSALKAEYEALKLKAASQKKINVVNEGINV